MHIVARSLPDSQRSPCISGKPVAPDQTWRLAPVRDVITGRDLGVLTSIFDPDCQIACWQRGALVSVASDIERALALGDLRTGFRTMVAPGDLQSGLPRSMASCPALCADIAFLVELYADLMGCQKVGLRLEHLNNAMCPRFHVDRTGIRMLCTYRGPGTEWLVAAAADRGRLGVAAGPSDEASGVIRDPAAVGRAARFDVVLLKGSLWQGNAGRGAIHRSPQLEDGEAPRITLALDAIW